MQNDKLEPLCFIALTYSVTYSCQGLPRLEHCAFFPSSPHSPHLFLTFFPRAPRRVYTQNVNTTTYATIFDQPHQGQTRGGKQHSYRWWMLTLTLCFCLSANMLSISRCARAIHHIVSSHDGNASHRSAIPHRHQSHIHMCARHLYRTSIHSTGGFACCARQCMRRLSLLTRFHTGWRWGYHHRGMLINK